MSTTDVSLELDKAMAYCQYLQEEIGNTEMESGFTMISGNQKSVFCWMLQDVGSILRTIDNSIYRAVPTAIETTTAVRVQLNVNPVSKKRRRK